MSQLLTDEDLRTEREPVKEPPKRWLTVWRCKKSSNTRLGVFKSGQIYTPEKIYPSRDIADAKAAQWLAVKSRAHIWEYLGAFPEGERP